jgi:micrococcal nuclease
VSRTPLLLTAGFCGVALIAGLAGCGSPDSGPAPVVPDVPAPPAGAIRATVERVVDGDTFIASASGGSLRVRLIGINAPESVQPDAPVECFGREAAVALARLMPPGTTVSAAYEAGGPVDRFGRQLWDVWLEDGRFVQAELVRQGAAEARAYPPHTKHADLLERLEDVARTDDAGLYGACP